VCHCYRPISLLSNISKIFEKSNHAIIALTESIQEALDNNNFAIGIFIDLQKAFDTV